MTISETTPLLDAYIAREDLFDAFVAYKPSFREFSDMLRGEAVASAITLADVAAMVNVPATDLVALARSEEVEDVPATPVEQDESRPDWMEGADLQAALKIDTRPIFDNGFEPLEKILELVGQAGPRDLIVVEAPFCPAPLRRLLYGRGYDSYAEELVPDHWRCVFRPR